MKMNYNIFNEGEIEIGDIVEYRGELHIVVRDEINLKYPKALLRLHDSTVVAVCEKLKDFSPKYRLFAKNGDYLLIRKGDSDLCRKWMEDI